MQQTLVFVMVVWALVWGVACAETSACPQAYRIVDGACVPPAPPCPDEVTRVIPMGCLPDPPEFAIETGEPLGFFRWELTVEPGRIESGVRFAAGFRGRLLVGEDAFNLGLTSLGPFRRVAVTNVEARVQVRKGAVGDDVELKYRPTYSCTFDPDGLADPESHGPFPACSVERNNPDGSNDDCTVDGQTDPANKCLPYYPVPTSPECFEDGRCDELGQVGPGTACEQVGFCADGEVVVDLEGAVEGASFIADGSGSVLFGWAERGVDVIEGGPDRGVFALESIRRAYGRPIQYSGIDALLGPIQFPIAFECITGEQSRRSDLGTTEIGLGRIPDSALIACPIQELGSN